MINLENPVRLIRELKGAPLSILFALSVVRQRVTQEWLERSTGYTDKPVSQALAYLQEIGLADHTGAGWQLCGAARQLPLPLGGELEEGDAPVPTNGGEDQEKSVCVQTLLEDCNSDTNCQGRKYSDSLIIINNDSINDSINDFNNNNNNGPSRKNSDSGGKKKPKIPISDQPVDKPVDNFSETRLALASAGIVGRKQAELARQEGVTPGVIRAWEAELKQKKGKAYTPGLLVVTLESGAAAPNTRENGHLESCRCEDCDQLERSEYAKGWTNPGRRS